MVIIYIYIYIQWATYIYKCRLLPPYHTFCNNFFNGLEIILQIISIWKIISPHTNCMGATYIYKCRLLTEYCVNKFICITERSACLPPTCDLGVAVPLVCSPHTKMIKRPLGGVEAAWTLDFSFTPHPPSRQRKRKEKVKERKRKRKEKK